MDYAAERALHDRMRQLVADGIAVVAHDVSDGGLAVSLAEMSLGGIGGRFDLPGEGGETARLFGEDHGRILVAYEPANRTAVGGKVLGTTGGDRLILGGIDVSTRELIDAWQAALPQWVG